MQYKKIIAKTVIGSEFTYNRKSAMFVSEQGASAICAVMNRVSFGLKNGEIWHVYDAQYADDMFITQVVKRRKGRIWITQA